jgi:hypothetical protein
VTTTPVFPPPVTPEQIDTVILLRPTDEQNPPDRDYLTCQMKIANCYLTGTYDSLLRCIKKLARQRSGNVAAIKEAGKYFTTVNVYSLPAPQLLIYKEGLESLQHDYEESIKNIAVVYIVDQDELMDDIFFNDSLVARLKGVGFDGLRDARRTTLTFGGAGVLSIRGAGKIDIRPGKEYYILLLGIHGRHGEIHQYRVIDRDRFLISGVQLF